MTASVHGNFQAFSKYNFLIRRAPCISQGVSKSLIDHCKPSSRRGYSFDDDRQLLQHRLLSTVWFHLRNKTYKHCGCPGVGVSVTGSVIAEIFILLLYVGLLPENPRSLKILYTFLGKERLYCGRDPKDGV